MRDLMISVWTVNPARAGMILVSEMLPLVAEGKPRASGDDPKALSEASNRYA